ncbi:GATA zinc finger domain-containing protein 4 isoform X2 [Pygocentrus nattereri]|uniref:GATA zinc finger domain-containing protein 4 isoform X2 n=1 Tax=Pygocentrus nattereri TaxID=42514 RepID=UPI00189113FC|nr:GATA zinc finger domain-containing protein 4 isoform X2 [Pygocentrus nattereri]
MQVLCLLSLMLLAHSLLVQSVFKQVNIHCDHASNETAACLHNDSCNWKVELALCHTLEINCIDLGATKAVSFCNSSRECGFSHFPYKLNGTLDCDITKASPADNKHKIKCQLTEDYKKTICTTQEECHWNPNLRFKDVNDARCVVMHNVSHCIRASPELNLKEHLNCTITPANNFSSNRTEIGDISSTNGTEIGDNSSNNGTEIGDNSSKNGTETGDNSSNNGTEIGDNSSNNGTEIGDNSSNNGTEIGDNSSNNGTEIGDNSSNNGTEIGDNSSNNETEIGDNSSNNGTETGSMIIIIIIMQVQMLLFTGQFFYTFIFSLIFHSKSIRTISVDQLIIKIVKFCFSSDIMFIVIHQLLQIFTCQHINKTQGEQNINTG